MLRFAAPYWLYLLPLVLVLAGVATVRLRQWGRRRRAALGDEGLLDGLGASARGWRRRRAQVWVVAASLALWVLALANPQFGTRTRLAAVRNTEVIVALDVSQSMLATDVAPSRLDRAQLFFSDLLEVLGGERVGVILFAGEAYLQSPITSDYGAALQYVRSAGPERITQQGTHFAAALRLARQLLIRPEPASASETPPVPVRKVILLISDGENHEADAESVARACEEAGLRVVTAGIGTAAGATVPSGRGSVKRDAQGEVIVSKFDPAALERLAELGGGRYFDLNGNTRAAASQVAAYLDAENLGESTEERFEESASYFQLLVVLGLGGWAWAWWLGRAEGLGVADRAWQQILLRRAKPSLTP